jgi:hypothetical protein
MYVMRHFLRETNDGSLNAIFALATTNNSGYDTHLLNGCGGDTRNMRGD